ncbi:uncharacterized protein LOC131011036 [Salvia miltiorrhiza]|uniref:uncharacterized protein LOC131011036 n=1 Tax=Salvia miltiorrhiza TaxID=226208 RepID=UPI0025AD7B78|nr:uncharacterized protein LOC131011036 [Salvia miltiorrhiza]
MMGECEVSVVSKFEEKGLLVLSSSQYEKHTVSGVENENFVINPQYEKQSVDEELNVDSGINTQNEEQIVVVNGEGDRKCDWMDEYPPLTSRGVQVFSVNLVQSTTSWVDALKKPHVASLEEANVKIQMEKFMKVCSKNKKIRQDYVAKSTVRRFGTLNGRALGPVEKPTPHVVPGTLDGRVMLTQHVVQVFEKENWEKSTDDDDGLARKTEDIMSYEADLKEEVSIDKAEETERKVELKSEKREKKRHKRLRLRERKKALAIARDGFSLTSTQNDDEMLNEIETHNEASSSIKFLDADEEEQQQTELLELVDSKEEEQPQIKLLDANEEEQQNELLELVDANEEAQQQTELLELVEGNEETQLREKRRKKKMTRKKRNKARAAATNARKKWILLIFINLTLVLCLIFNLSAKFFTRLYIF